MSDDKNPNHFRRLDMAAIIDEPLKVACEAQNMLAGVAVDYNERAGLEEKDEDKPTVTHKIRNISFSSTGMGLKEPGVEK